MKYNPSLHHRRSIRLRNYDYANAGAYFVTICLNQRTRCSYAAKGQPQGVAPTFGEIENGAMILNGAGKMIHKIWDEMPGHYNGMKTGEFVIMPDHIHGIIEICDDNVGATPCGCPLRNGDYPDLPHLMNCFKTMTTTKYIQGVKADNWIPFSKKLWQRNYWEHVIRDETECVKISRYIRNNPALWGRKCLNEILPQCSPFEKDAALERA